MNKFYLTLASFASLGLTNIALAANTPQAQVPVAATPSQPTSSQFTPAQLAEIEKSHRGLSYKKPRNCDDVFPSWNGKTAKRNCCENGEGCR